MFCDAKEFSRGALLHVHAVHTFGERALFRIVRKGLLNYSLVDLFDLFVKLSKAPHIEIKELEPRLISDDGQVAESFGYEKGTFAPLTLQWGVGRNRCTHANNAHIRCIEGLASRYVMASVMRQDPSNSL